MTTDQPVLDPNKSQPPEEKNKSAFIQVPVALKEEVEAYVNERMLSSDLKLSVDDESIKELPSEGCFLVISLEKVEKIVNSLNECLAMDTSSDSGAGIKAELRHTLTLLS